MTQVDYQWPEASILDQTRIHRRNYDQVRTIVRDLMFKTEENVDQAKIEKALAEIIQDPAKLKMFALGEYKEEIKKIDMVGVEYIFQQVIEDLIRPFADPREQLNVVRDIAKNRFSNKTLFYCLIDESERSFKEGIIVSATVQRIFDPQDNKAGRIACRLENGIDANIHQADCTYFDSGSASREVEIGSIITGRLHQIRYGDRENSIDEQRLQSEDNFSVVLKCKKSDIKDHRAYVETLGYLDDIPKEDLINEKY